MKTIDETEVLKFFVAQAVDDARTFDLSAIDHFTTEDLKLLNDGLAEALLEDARQSDDNSEAASESGYLTWSETQIDSRSRRKSVLWRGRERNHINTLVSFNFGDSFFESAVPLLGLCIVLFIPLHPLLTAPSTFQIGRTLLGKLRILRRPEDANAIDTLNAILALRSKHKHEDKGGLPTTGEISAYRCVNSDTIVPALQRLMNLEVIKCEHWGGQAGDVSHLNNAWKIPL